MWLVDAIISMFFMGAMALAIKKTTLFLIPHSWILMFAFLFGAFFYLVHSFSSKNALHLTGQSLIWILLIAVFSYLGNLFGIKSISSAPNPGYTMAIIGCSSIVVLLGSFVFFDGNFSLTKVVGIVLCVAGVIIISI